MKKEVIMFFVVLLSVNFVIAAADVAYVLKNTGRADAGFVEAFGEMGLSVELIESKDMGGIDFSKYKFIFIGDERLKNIDEISSGYPGVIANHYYGKEFNLINKGRISKLAANSPLKVKKQNSAIQIIEVYIQSNFKLGGINLPYYYLPQKYKNENMQTIATTSVGYEKELGDVISYSTQGAKRCFFGITKTKFWTDDAKKLFKDCVEFVVGEENIEIACSGNEECGQEQLIDNFCIDDEVWSNYSVPACLNAGTQDSLCNTMYEQRFSQECIYGCANGGCSDNTESVNETNNNETIAGELHDVSIVEDYSNSINGIRIRDKETTDYLLDEISQLMCSNKYIISYKTMNIGNFTENITFTGMVSDFNWTSTKENLEAKEYTTAGSKTINITFEPGIYSVEIFAEINEDNNPENNLRNRSVEVVC